MDTPWSTAEQMLTDKTGDSKKEHQHQTGTGPDWGDRRRITKRDQTRE